jgi:hypothetical protein
MTQTDIINVRVSCAEMLRTHHQVVVSLNASIESGLDAVPGGFSEQELAILRDFSSMLNTLAGAAGSTSGNCGRMMKRRAGPRKNS